ncbi:glycoside hydrolase family 16 protein [Cantharellus anzutake]|uniref:glycoside hydrolase family 16 protein n=1 Tax=Cantharellus anzutake TaxID=1750568 RepID=UPI0019052C98|nr:glycoside hydrolase family 16 protein [Cantharellus anzutake]KAF8320967.1 glycoside hydrolase family 16 protein [Cantharellus anzutake]
MTDSKYAQSTAAFLPYKSDADPRAKFLSIDQYGPYERLGGPADDDDFIHEPGQRNLEVGGFSWRGLINIAMIILLLIALLTLFAVYPIVMDFTMKRPWESFHFNGTGQIPALTLLPSAIDPVTPKDVYTRIGVDGQEYELVFSDEFETPGRSFYPGDDPFWEAVDLWASHGFMLPQYWATGDLEWYDPGQVTTRDGALVIVIEDQESHGRIFKSGMIQSWNKFCFTTGYMEVSVIFPGAPDVSGYWPGVWMMGNLGRPGYGATADGLWPYSYDTCDVGTLPNQTLNGEPAIAATAGGNKKYNYNLSWQPGQRLSACTCPGEDHPGPVNTKGRAAPEIDIFEAQKNKEGYGGRVTQSVQLAPFNNLYYFPNTSADVTIYNPQRTKLNTYRYVQQAISALTDLNDTAFELGGAQFTKFGVEFWSDPNNRQDGHIAWIADQPVFAIDALTFSADPTVNISDRIIPEEPMAMVLNLAVSESFQKVDVAAMTFPAEMKVDYVRVWQRKGLKDSVTCDPPNYPTAKYINDHINVYTNPNLTLWSETGYSKPKNRLVRLCSLRLRNFSSHLSPRLTNAEVALARAFTSMFPLF